MSSLRIKAHEIIDKISDNRIMEVIDFLEFLKIKEEYEATKELLEDEVFIEAFNKGRKQIDNGEYEAWEDVREHV